MTTIVIKIVQKGLRTNAVDKEIRPALDLLYPDAVISIERKEPAESRADRYAEAQGLVSDARDKAEELREELQNWVDSLPEQLQGGDKNDQLDDAIQSLEDFISSCEDAEGNDVEFPGMMG